MKKITRFLHLWLGKPDPHTYIYLRPGAALSERASADTSYSPLRSALSAVFVRALWIYALAVLLAVTFAMNAYASDVRGALYDHGVLVTGGIRDYDLALRGGDRTYIRVRGDGDGDIDCFLAGASGVIVAFDVEREDGCLLVVELSAGYVAPHRLRLVNYGAQASEYTLRVR